MSLHRLLTQITNLWIFSNLWKGYRRIFVLSHASHCQPYTQQSKTQTSHVFIYSSTPNINQHQPSQTTRHNSLQNHSQQILVELGGQHRRVPLQKTRPKISLHRPRKLGIKHRTLTQLLPLVSIITCTRPGTILVVVHYYRHDIWFTDFLSTGESELGDAH